MTHQPPGIVVLAAVAAGGAAGGTLRWGLGWWLGSWLGWGLGDIVPDHGGFPWTTFAVNLSGSLTLALLPGLAVVRRRPTLAVFLGPGLLGGYTTLSTYAEQARAMLAAGRVALAAAYVLGTLAACLLAVTLAGRCSTPLERRAFAAEEGNE